MILVVETQTQVRSLSHTWHILCHQIGPLLDLILFKSGLIGLLFGHYHQVGWALLPSWTLPSKRHQVLISPIHHLQSKDPLSLCHQPHHLQFFAIHLWHHPLSKEPPSQKKGPPSTLPHHMHSHFHHPSKKSSTQLVEALICLSSTMRHRHDGFCLKTQRM